MKLLLIHCDWIEWQATKKALKDAGEASKEPVRVEETLAVFTAVEKDDSKNPETVCRKAVEGIEDVCRQIKADSLVLYPYAHLSSSLSTPASALSMLDRMENALKEKKFKVARAPFGWYKKLSLSAKGHPLAELSKEITAEAEKEMEKQAAIFRRSRVSKEEVGENDHRVIGQKLDLYSFQEPAPGMVFFHPKGMTIINQLLALWREEHVRRGYREISTPLLMNRDLWIVSGHWDHYKEHMFFTSVEGSDFALKPMNCPGAILVYKSATRSYRELPLRLAELGKVHRNELSGVLSGLFRLRAFTQDDAHIFVSEKGLEREIARTVEFVDYIYSLFGFRYHVELSTRPEKFMGSKELWDRAEKALQNALKQKGLKYKINKGEGAFYGPKIDFHIKDNMDRTWQCATIQVDFQMPEKFDLKYTDEENKEVRPVIIHRVIYGAIERFLGILVEHCKGAFPLWLSPVQVKALSFTDRNKDSVERFAKRLEGEGFRVEADMRDHTVEYKVRDAEVQRMPYIVVIGDREEKNDTIAVRKRGSQKVEYGVKKEAFIGMLKRDISERE